MLQQDSSAALPTPSLKRRLTCMMIYEAALVFGLVFFTDAIHDILTQSRDPSMHRISRIALIFGICGLYFIYFWRRSGQTLAMQTWRIKLVNSDGGQVPVSKAVLRYCLAWMWFFPGIVISSQINLPNGQKFLPIIIGFVAWAATVYFNKDRQFLHDLIAKTRLVQLAPATTQDEKIK
ncbi:MAG: RDD family protein [Undibacterium sp.]|nr:RDD family protein [Undibacterium sp.]